MTENALRTLSSDIFLFINSILSLPLERLTIFRVATINVVVLIPPAIEPGEPPIHINNIVNINEGMVNKLRSIVFKPPDLGVTAAKKELIIFPSSVLPANALLYSIIKNETVPTLNKRKVVNKIIRVLILICHV